MCIRILNNVLLWPDFLFDTLLHTMVAKNNIHNTVYEFRARAGETQEALADAVGITRQTVIAIEKGNYRPSVYLALMLAKHFSTSVESLFKIE